MPVKKCSNGKWRIGSGDCMYTSKASAEKAYKGYLGSKYAEEQKMTKNQLDERKLVHAVDEDNESDKPMAADVARMMKLAGIDKKLEDDQEEGRVDFNGVFTGVAKGDIDVKESRFGMFSEYAKKKVAEADQSVDMDDEDEKEDHPHKPFDADDDGDHDHDDHDKKMTESNLSRIMIEMVIEEFAKGKSPKEVSDDLCFEERDVQNVYNFVMEKAKKRNNISQLPEGKDTHCSDECCGSEVKAADCTCPPSCPHCNCNALKEGKKPDFLDVDKDGDKKEPMTKAIKDKKKKVKEGYRAPKNGSFQYLAPNPSDPEDEVEIDVEWEMSGETGRDGFVFYATGPDGNEFPLDSNLEYKLHDYLQSELEGDYADWGDYEHERRRDAEMFDSYDAELNELSKDEASLHNIEPGEMVRVTNFKAKTARYKVLMIKGDRVKLEKPDGSTMVMPLDRIKRVKAQAHKHQNSMMGEGANVKALQQQLKDLDQEYQAALAGMSDADENEIADEMERLADQIYRLGGSITEKKRQKKVGDGLSENDYYARMAQLAGVQYSAPRPVTEDDLNEDSSLSALGIPKTVISRIHKLTNASHNIDMIPVRNKSEVKAALDNQGFVVVVGDGDYGVAAYSHGHGSGSNVYYDARRYDAEGNVIAKERGALTSVLKVLPKGKYYGFNPEKSRGWGNEWRGEKNPYSSTVRWAGADEMVTKIADRVEERAHEALKTRALEIRDQLAQQLEPGDSGIDLGDNYEKLTMTMKHAASLYKRPNEFRSHLENTVKRYLLKFEKGTDKVDNYAVNPDKWSKRDWGRSPKDFVSSRINQSREGDKFKSEGQLINRIARAVIDFYRNLGDQYSDNELATKVGSVN